MNKRRIKECIRKANNYGIDYIDQEMIAIHLFLLGKRKPGIHYYDEISTDLISRYYSIKKYRE